MDRAFPLPLQLLETQERQVRPRTEHRCSREDQRTLCNGFSLVSRPYLRSRAGFGSVAAVAEGSWVGGPGRRGGVRPAGGTRLPTAPILSFLMAARDRAGLGPDLPGTRTLGEQGSSDRRKLPQSCREGARNAVRRNNVATVNVRTQEAIDVLAVCACKLSYESLNRNAVRHLRAGQRRSHGLGTGTRRLAGRPPRAPSVKSAPDYAPCVLCRALRFAGLSRCRVILRVP